MGVSTGDAVRVEGLHKSYGDWPVLWDLDLRVGWGEFLVLFGANGAGKTTLLRILSTQARPDAGTVFVAGFDRLRRPESVRRRVGVVGHRSFLYEDLTCRENLAFYARLYRLDDPKTRIDALLARVGLADRAEQRFRTLSHGMQKRLSIARAMLHQPLLLLLDEPESGLDRESVDTLRDLLGDWTASGRAVVMTTHNVDLGLAWADRVAVLSSGKVKLGDAGDAGNGSGVRRALSASSESGR